ncbi:hypothetical protein C2G38_2093389 [Gigaspora rosea]|uniref:Uncharacterized protein n=1 Tax=Gigaspora rosea TaxID=44941 RepID=A0A397V1R8_9GLOM|nr:hypothetical protein C2G38_2093389 [Gigaspora rosea]
MFLKIIEDKKNTSIWLYLLIMTNIFLVLVCPILEAIKIKVFDTTNGEITYNKGAEYSYLILTCALLVLNFLSSFKWCTFDIRKYGLALRLTSCIWILFPVIYTYFTFKDIGSIPFACPTSYHYIYNLSQLACQLRVINFIFMWLYFCSFMLLIIVNWYLQKHETNLESVDFGDIDRPKSFTTRSSASLKRRSSIRKGTLKTKGSKRLSQTGSSTSSRNSLEMSEIDENQKNNANNLKLQGVYPEHVVEVVHQDDVHSDEYVVYDSTDEMESILIKTDTD